MMGVNINCKYQDFIRQITLGEKNVETRGSHSLRPYIGQRIGLVRAGCGKATLEGYATVIGEVTYDESAFRENYNSHRVAPGSRYDIKRGGIKYGYILADVVSCDPVPVTNKGIVARRI